MEHCRIMEIGADYVDVLQVAGTQPYVDRFRREAAVGEGEHSGAAGFENARDLAAHGQGLREVVDADGIRHNVERIVVKRQHVIDVEVFDHKRINMRVAAQLSCIHSECNAPSGKVRDVRREMRKMGGANVKNRRLMPLAKHIGIVSCEAKRRCLVDMVAEPRVFVEMQVRRFIQPTKVLFCERPS